MKFLFKLAYIACILLEATNAAVGGWSEMREVGNDTDKWNLFNSYKEAIQTY